MYYYLFCLNTLAFSVSILTMTQSDFIFLKFAPLNCTCTFIHTPKYVANTDHTSINLLLKKKHYHYFLRKTLQLVQTFY